MDVESGGVGGGVDDADLGYGLDAGDALTAGEGGDKDREKSEPGGAGREMAASEEHSALESDEDFPAEDDR